MTDLGEVDRLDAVTSVLNQWVRSLPDPVGTLVETELYDTEPPAGSPVGCRDAGDVLALALVAASVPEAWLLRAKLDRIDGLCCDPIVHAEDGYEMDVVTVDALRRALGDLS